MSEDSLIGKNLGPYEIMTLLGRGPNSAVYRAYEANTNRTIAIKIVAPQFLDEPGFQEQFEREVRRLSDLDHPHILKVHEAGVANGYPYFSMEYVTGGTLANMLARYGKLSLAETVPIIQQVAAALDYAQAQGVVHRYLKPSNILLDEHGTAFVTDFGNAAVREASVSASQSGILGGAGYVAPEVISGTKKTTSAADVYSLGVIAFEMLTGQLPFKGENAAVTAKMHLTSNPPSPRSVNLEIPEAVDQVILKALAKNPKERYSSAGAFSDALSEAAGVTTSAVKQRSESGEFRRPMMPPPPRPPLTPPPGSLRRIDLEPETPPPGSLTPPPTPAPISQTPPPTPPVEPITPPPMVRSPETVTPIPGATPLVGMPALGGGAPPSATTPPPSPPPSGGSSGAISLKDMPAKDRRKIERDRAKQRREIQRRLGLGTRWYTVVLAVVLVILVWFVIGVLIGNQLRQQERAIALAGQHNNETATATAASGHATETALAVAVVGTSETDTPSPTEEEGTPTPTSTEIKPTDTPTSSVTPSPSPTATVIGGSRGLIAFISKQDGDAEIYTLDIATNVITQVTKNGADDGWPVWSPDGKLIAYHSKETTQGQHIFMIAPDGTGKVELTHGIRVDSFPVWSADGTVIAYHSFESARSFIRTTDLAAQKETTLEQIPAGENRLFDWSPDGFTITYFGYSPAGKLEIIRLSLDTHLRTAITQSGGTIDYLNYSPDRRLVIFTKYGGSNKRQIFIADNNPSCQSVTDCNTRQVTDDGSDWSHPHFSPDGTLIVAASDQDGNLDLFLLTVDGSIVQKLTDSPSDDYDAVWQP